MSLRDLFTDADHVIQTWDDYCQMCDGIEACQLGEECTDQGAAFRYGYAQEQERQQAQESMS